jgi:hypothetical protein
MVAKKKNMEGGTFGLVTKNYSNLEDIFVKLKLGDSILNKVRVEQRLRGFLQVLAKELHQYSVANEDKYQKLYHMFIQICEKYPSEIRKIQEKELITLEDTYNENKYIHEPFYFIIDFFLKEFKTINNKNKIQKIKDIININTNNNNRRMNHLLNKMNTANTSDWKKFKSVFSTNRKNEFLDIADKKIEKFNKYEYKGLQDIEKNLERLKKLLEKLDKFKLKIQTSYSLKSRFAKICESLFKVFSNKILELLLQNEAAYEGYKFQKSRGISNSAEVHKQRFLELDLEKLSKLLDILVELFKDKITPNKNYDELLTKIKEQNRIKTSLKYEDGIINNRIKFLDFAEQEIELFKSRFNLTNIELEFVKLRKLLQELNKFTESQSRERLYKIYLSLFDFLNKKFLELTNKRDEFEKEYKKPNKTNYRTADLKKKLDVSDQNLIKLKNLLEDLLNDLYKNTSQSNSFKNQAVNLSSIVE